MTESQKSRGKATDTLVADAITVAVGAQTYVIKSFCFAKTVRVFQFLSELAAAAGIDQLVEAAQADNDSRDAGATGFIARALQSLPKLLTEGVPTVYKLLGLIVTGNRELRELEKADGIDVDQALYERGVDIAYADDGTVQEVVDLITASVKVMGVETVVSALGPMVRMLTAR